jgi:2-hydroxy-6-oxonona-2,4-dienedioate hydrolase
LTDFSSQHRNVDGTQPTVVFVSALFAGGWIWDHPFAALAEEGVPVLRTNEAICAVDPKIAGSIERLGDAVLETCDEAGVGEVVVVANSLGGLVAIDLAGRLPDRVRGLVVSGAPGLTPDPDVGLNMDRRASVRPSGPEFGDRILSALFHGECLFSPERVAETGNLLMQGPSMVAMARSIKATRTYEIHPALARVAVPSLYVWGRYDRMTPMDPWLESVPKHEGTEFIVVEDCGHIPMVERPDEYTDHLRRFVKETV